MRFFGIIVGIFLIQPAKAQTITVEDVKVSVTADSAASARDQALDQAHQLAFQKLVKENFPESTLSLPSEDTMRDMVRDFSINREKTTPTSYTASLTFQFDEPRVLTWAQQSQHRQQASASLPIAPQLYEKSEPLKILATYGTHSEWQYIKKTLENLPGVQNLSIFTLSPKNASMRINYIGLIDKLQKGLMEKGIILSQQDEEWVASLNGQTLR